MTRQWLTYWSAISLGIYTLLIIVGRPPIGWNALMVLLDAALFSTILRLGEDGFGITFGESLRRVLRRRRR